LPLIDSTAITPLPRDNKSKPIETDPDGEIVSEKGTMPTTLSPVMNGMLRKDLHFDGLIVTDAMSMSGLTIYFTPEEASVRAIEAGAFVIAAAQVGRHEDGGVHEAVKKGRLTEQRIDESCAKSWQPSTIWDWSSNGSLRLKGLIVQLAASKRWNSLMRLPPMRLRW
jgi:beta-N-acetylhexosaminidase